MPKKCAALARNCVIELQQLLQRLHAADVDFVIVGGFAATLHGSTLLTRDLDVCAMLDAVAVEKLRAQLADLHPTHRQTSQRLSFITHPEPGLGVQNLYLETDLGAIDLLGSIIGVGDFARVRMAAIEVELFGQRCPVIAVEDLIASKEALGRDKDRLAVAELRAILARRR